MFDVPMLDDIKTTEKRLNKFLTMRQFVCILIGSLYAVPIAYFVPFNWFWKIIIGLTLIAPAFFCGNPRLLNHEPLEIIFIRAIYKHFLTPQKRLLKSNNIYREVLNKIKKKEEVEKLKKLPAKEKSKYLKEKANKKVIPSKNPNYKLYT